MSKPQGGVIYQRWAKRRVKCQMPKLKCQNFFKAKLLRAPKGRDMLAMGAAHRQKMRQMISPERGVIYFMKSQRHEFYLPVILLHSQTGVWERGGRNAESSCGETLLIRLVGENLPFYFCFATSSAASLPESITSGMPPPGCAEPPAKYSPR